MTAARFGTPIVASANSFIDVSPALQAYAALNTNAARGAVRDIEQLR